MPKALTESGIKINRLTSVRYIENRRNKRIWLFICECGKSIQVPYVAVRSGNTKSCGCLKAEILKNRSTTHGYAPRKNPRRAWLIWRNIQTRCTNKNRNSWNEYGGRGIRCEWSDFLSFFKDMGDPPTESHSIERIDVNGNYSKLNCRWATRLEQSRNKRKSKILSFGKRTLHLKEWSVATGISYWTLRSRYDRGLPAEEILGK